MRKNIVVSAICVFVMALAVLFIYFYRIKDDFFGNKSHRSNASDATDDSYDSKNEKADKNGIVVEFLETPVNLSSHTNLENENNKDRTTLSFNQKDDINTEQSEEIGSKTYAGAIDETLPAKRGMDGKDGLNGKDGTDGRDGKDGLDGKDGKNGRDGLDGKDGKNGLNGKNGEDGRTPEKGVDYFTDDEKREMVNEVVKEVYGLADNGEIVFSAENAYEVWLHNHEGTEEDFFNYLKGDKGDKGDPGPEGEVKISNYTADYDEGGNCVTFRTVTSNGSAE